MDELIVFLRQLLIQDTVFAGVCASAGSAKAIITAPRQRAVASYPKTVIDGDDGDDVWTGDILPKYFRARLRLEFYARLSDADTDPLGTRQKMFNRARDLITGIPANAANGMVSIPGITGQVVGPNWRVCSASISANNIPNTEDETICRKDIRVEVLLSRITL
jgi:hypothetical protein